MAKIALILMVFCSSALAQTKWYLMEFGPTTPEKAKILSDATLTLSRPTLGMSFEYTPAPDTKDLDQNMARFNFVADQPNAALIAKEFAQLARDNNIPVTTDRFSQSKRKGYEACFDTHGVDLANRQAMKACARNAQRESRVMPASEVQKFRSFMRSKGFLSEKEFNEWLDEN